MTGSAVTVRFVLVDANAQRAAKTLQRALERVLTTDGVGAEIVSTPDILDAVNLGKPERKPQPRQGWDPETKMYFPE